jgi:hypothetical protein
VTLALDACAVLADYPCDRMPIDQVAWAAEQAEAFVSALHNQLFAGRCREGNGEWSCPDSDVARQDCAQHPPPRRWVSLMIRHSKGGPPCFSPYVSTDSYVDISRERRKDSAGCNWLEGQFRS